MARIIGGYAVEELRSLAAERRGVLVKEIMQLKATIREANTSLSKAEDELRQLEATRDLLN